MTNKHFLLTLFFTFFVVVFFRANDIAAQTSCPSGRALTAQERIAQRDIQERIDASIEADIARDDDASAFILTADFTLKLLNGTLLNRQQFLSGNKEQKDGLLLISDKTRITINCLTLKGKEAAVYTNQHYVRYMPDRKDGSPHEVITNITHKETWVFTGEGWKVKHIEELKRGRTLLNGEVYNPCLFYAPFSFNFLEAERRKAIFTNAS